MVHRSTMRDLGAHEAHAAFVALDGDDDGSITQNDLNRRLLDFGVDASDAGAFFLTLDAGSEGNVGENCFLCHWPQYQSLLAGARPSLLQLRHTYPQNPTQPVCSVFSRRGRCTCVTPHACLTVCSPRYTRAFMLRCGPALCAICIIPWSMALERSRRLSASGLCGAEPVGSSSEVEDDGM